MENRVILKMSMFREIPQRGEYVGDEIYQSDYATVVYEGGILNAGTEVRILDGESVRAEGKVIKSGKSNYFKYAEIWL